MKKLSTGVVLLVAASFLGPVLQCGAGSISAKDTMACCRAMGSKCHKMRGGGACCTQKLSGLLPLISAPPAAHFSGLQAIFAAAFLPPAVPKQFRSSVSQSATVSVAHSPPGNISLFIFHSTLLI